MFSPINSSSVSSSVTPGVGIPSTPVGTQSNYEDVNFIEEPDVDLREEMFKRCVSWTPTSDYITIPGFRLPKVIQDQNEWLSCAQVFETYLRTHFMAYKLWIFGKFEPPATIIYEESNISRSLGPDFNGTTETNQSSQASINSSTSIRRKCRLVKDHPMYDLFINNSSLANIQIAIDFYNRMMAYILDLLRYSVGMNKRASNILATYGIGDLNSMFKMATEINKLFCGQCTMASRSRRYQFGNIKIWDSKCKTFEEFTAFMFEERRWIQLNWNEWRSDSELLEGLINGISGSEKYLRIYNFLMDRQKPGQEIQIDIVLE